MTTLARTTTALKCGRVTGDAGEMGPERRDGPGGQNAEAEADKGPDRGRGVEIGVEGAADWQNRPLSKVGTRICAEDSDRPPLLLKSRL